MAVNVATLGERPWAAALARAPCEAIATPAGRLTVRRAGDGPDLVLLHGIGSGAASWAWQLDGLADRSRVTAWNAPGYGGSAPPAKAWPDAGDYAKALDALLTALGIERAVVLGHSLGALIAARLAADCPTRVKGLILADPAAGHGRLDEATRSRRLEERIKRFRELGPLRHAEARAPHLLSPRATADQLALVRFGLERLNEAGYGKAARLLAQGDIVSDVERIRLPALVVFGAEDRITPPADCRRIAASFPVECRVVEIAGTGHASYIEAPARFNEVVRHFMESLS